MTGARRNRGHGEGSIQQYKLKSGELRFYISWYEPSDPLDHDSPKKRRLQRGFREWEEARRALRGKLAAIDAGELSAASRTDGPLLATFLNEWLTSHRVASNTRESYGSKVRLHINPYIGDIPVARVNPRVLSGLYRILEEKGNRRSKPVNGKPVGLGPNSVRQVHHVLSIALESAVEDRLININPASLRGANPPSGKDVVAAKAEIDVWKVHQLTDFLSWAGDHNTAYFALWWFIAHTGVRRGEAVGLRWKDIEPGIVQVRRSVATVKVKGEGAFDETRLPKGAKTRTVAIDEGTVTMLRQHRADQGAKHGFGAIRPDSPVFIRPDGDPLRPQQVSVRWETATRRYHKTRRGSAAARLTVHGLRHTHASHLLAAGVHPKVVQNRLGHGSIGITMDLYSHLMDSVQTAAMNAYSDMLKRDSAPSKDDIDYELYGEADDDEAGGSGNIRPL